MRVVFYNAATIGKVSSLQRLFNDYVCPGTGIQVVQANQHTVQQELAKNPRIFVMPGAHESSAYRSEIAGPAFDALVTSIDRGMHVLGICAGAYVLSREFEYRVYDNSGSRLKEVRQIKSSLGLVNVRAYGPDLRLYQPRPRQPGNPWSFYSLTEIGFDTANGPRAALVAISRAPSFVEAHPAQCRVMARYRQTGDAAMLSFKLGQGGGVLAGPAIEVGGYHLQQAVHPRYLNNAYSQQVVQQLEASAPAWSDLILETFKVLLPGEDRLHKRIAANLARQCQ